MSTKLVMQLVVDDPSLADVASLLAAVSRIPDAQLKLLLACESAPQAGQIRRRLRERLEAEKLDAKTFRLDNHGRNPYLDISLPPLDMEMDKEHEVVLEADIAEVEPPTVELPQVPLAVSPSGKVFNKQVPEGNYKVKLREAFKEERSGKLFISIQMEICEGSHRGTQIEDRVIVWPVTARTQHLAKAIGLEPESLGTRIDTKKGAEFWNRRRENIEPDGSSKISNFYYPLETPPPPFWEGFKGA